jgi:DNA-binding NarL/FixJ family response regulator
MFDGFEDRVRVVEIDSGESVREPVDVDAALIDSALNRGVDGYLSKAIPAIELVEALEAIHSGKRVVNDGTSRTRSSDGLEWPGKVLGITDRESEVLALITQGKSNADIATLTYLSPNTVKSYIRSTYRKIEVESRTQAVLWGVSHGFTPNRRRLDNWRPAADGDS